MMNGAATTQPTLSEPQKEHRTIRQSRRNGHRPREPNRTVNKTVDDAKPRNSEVQLTERIECELRRTGYMQLHDLDVTVCEGLVVLKGTVPTYYLKQMAQAKAMAIHGVLELRNDVEVI